MAELRREVFLMGLESTKGTAVRPTDYAAIRGTLVPQFDITAPDEQRGINALRYRTARVKEWGTFSGDGPLDLNLFPFLMQMVSSGTLGSQPTTPAGAVRLWTLPPDMDSDDRKTASVWWGDADVQHFMGAFGIIDSLSINADGSGSDSTQMSISGMTQAPGWTEWAGDITGISAASSAVVLSTVASAWLAVGDKVRFSEVVGMTEINGLTGNVTAITSGTDFTVDIDSTAFTPWTSGGLISLQAVDLPTQVVSPLIAPLEMKVFLDDTTIGTTEIVANTISVSHDLALTWGPKYRNVGPGGSKTYSDMGYGGHVLSTNVTMELPNLDQYNLFKDDTVVKLRIEHYGPIIESTYRYQLTVDTYGRLQFSDWGEVAGTNRTIGLLVESEYDSGAGHDHQFITQCERTS